MAGFVDVSNMTDEQVKRICQQDEVSTNPHTRKYIRQVPVMVNGMQIFIAAAAAHRINNGEYIKASSFYLRSPEAQQSVQPNRDIMESVMKGEISPTQEDIDMAESIRTHFKGLTLQILAGKILNDYQAKALSLSTLEQIDSRELNTVASLPSAYSRDQKRKTVEDRLYDCASSYLGPIGSKVNFKAEILRQVFSQNWGCYFITAITECNHSVFFASKNELKVGDTKTFKGQVKSHRPQYQTQLNYVKVLG